jgi:phage regulator Rha-like protein
MQVATQVVTMSSREIAELVESRHDDVKRSIERLATAKVSAAGTQTPAVIELPPMAEVKNHLGQMVKEYRLCKRDSYVVVAQLSPAFTARLVDRWQELEAVVAAPAIDLNDPAFLRSTLLTYAEKVIALEAKITEQEPKVNALRRIAEAEGSFCISDAAKMLQMPPRQLFIRLNEMRWIFKRLGCAVWLGYQDKTQAGLLVHKSTLVTREDGTEKVAEQVRITGRGIARVATLLGAAVVEVEEATA